MTESNHQKEFTFTGREIVIGIALLTEEFHTRSQSKHFINPSVKESLLTLAVIQKLMIVTTTVHA